MSKLFRVFIICWLFLLGAPAFAQQPGGEESVRGLQVVPQWVWLGEAADNPQIALRRQFVVPGEVFHIT